MSFDLGLFESQALPPVEPWTDPPSACENPFRHLTNLAETEDHPCGHQKDVLPCGCVYIDDHDTEPCEQLAAVGAVRNEGDDQ